MMLVLAVSLSTQQKVFFSFVQCVTIQGLRREMEDQD